MSPIEKDFKNWLYKVAIWKISDFRRASGAGKRIPHVKIVPIDEAGRSKVISRGGIDTLEADEKRFAWNLLFEKIPREERQLIVLRYFEGQNYQEIATIISKKKLTRDELLKLATIIRKRVSRLHEKLRKMILNEPLLREALEI